MQLLNEFLSLPSFPYLVRGTNFRISDAKILIEQSFSDFGDADVLLLATTDKGDKKSIFIEAKVKTFQKQRWGIRKEFEKFNKGHVRGNKISSSNLFTQLYYKVRLVKALQKESITRLQKEGIQFPKHFSKGKRKIGNNKVVVEAVKELKPYCENTLFIALVPDDISNIRSFYEVTLKNYSSELPEWEVRNWGYVYWGQVENFCEENRLEETLKVFEFNKGQIY